VVASSSFTADLVKSSYEIEAAKLSVIPPTYMLGDTPAPVQSANGSAQDRQVRLVSLCRLDERKGLMQALTALHEEETIKTDWRWDIIGNGPQAEPLKQAVQAFGMAERVCFHHEVGDSDKSLMLGQADLFVMPSFQKGHSVEGFGISHVEAAQYGLPAIAGAIGGSVDAVLDGETGWCVDANDARQIGEALAEAINMADERHRRGQAAYERFTAEFVGAAVFSRFATQALNSKKN
jgi:phosphatidylinositol alpha-1,6-mannosyltransferase